MIGMLIHAYLCTHRAKPTNLLENAFRTVKPREETLAIRDAMNILLNKGVPKLLVDEGEALHRVFDIKANIHPHCLYKQKTGYSLDYRASIDGKSDVLKFYRMIGFACKQKNESLEKYLKEVRWL
jgi:hypothetical protein